MAVYIFSSLSHVDCTKMVVTLWSIWYAGRKAVYDHEFQSPQATHGVVSHYISELDSLIKCKPIQVNMTTPRAQRLGWLSRPPGCAKFNVDGAVSRNADMGAVAMVCRDDSGHYLGSSCHL
jgi:hypothetical protein